MSYEATRWAWKQSTTSVAAKFVLICLADMANKEQACWPSHAAISERTGLSQSSVIRAIHELESAFLVAIQRRTKKGAKINNLYILNVARD